MEARAAAIRQKLSPRLLTLAKFVPAGVVPADIGTDHAYLPLYLVASGVCPQAIGGDVHIGPYQAAQKAVREFGLMEQISVRLGDGLQVLEPGEAEVAIIAGMGGGTMQGILEASPEVANVLCKLILQPMVDAGQLRKWLLEHDWSITDEELVEEDGRLYELLLVENNRFEKGVETVHKRQSWDQLILEVGPKLLAKKHPLLYQHLDKLIHDRTRVIQQISNSQSPTAQDKAINLQAEVVRLQKLQDSL